MTAHYETVFILNPVLSDAQVKDTVEKFKKALTGAGANITHEEAWGLRSLAYLIDSKKSGYYFYLEFTSPTSAIKTLEVEFTRDENVLRFLTTVLDKDAVEYNETRRKGAFNKKSKEAVA